MKYAKLIPTFFLALAGAANIHCVMRSQEINTTPKALSSGTYKNSAGEKVVDRFYLASLYTDSKKEGLGQALIYGIACYGEDPNPKALKNTPSAFSASRQLVEWKPKPLNERQYVHEFVTAQTYKTSEPLDDFERKERRKNYKKLVRQEGQCIVIHGSDKPQHHKVFTQEEYDKLEENIFASLSGTAGTCMNSTLTILATVGMAVGGAAAALPALVPATLSSSSVAGLIGVGLYCKPSLKSFGERLDDFKNQASAALLDTVWAEVGTLTEKSLKQKGMWDKFLDLKQSENLLESAKIYNPQFVENFNKHFAGKLEKYGGWFNAIKTITADDFFEYLNSVESEIGETTARALQAD
jgi:hypothetical protein